MTFADSPTQLPEALQIRSMAVTDMAAVCEVIGAAFADNPSTLANVRGDKAKAERTMRDAVRVVKFGRQWSHALVAERNGIVLGALNAAQWPHCQLGAVEKIRTILPMVMIMGEALPRALTMTRRREAHDPHEPHWHIGPLGVRPDAQGQGVGRLLLRSFLSKVDEERAPAFLETDVDRNVAFYQGFGFDVTVSEYIVGVDTRFMWRSARNAGLTSAPHLWRAGRQAVAQWRTRWLLPRTWPPRLARTAPFPTTRRAGHHGLRDKQLPAAGVVEGVMSGRARGVARPTAHRMCSCQ